MNVIEFAQEVVRRIRQAVDSAMEIAQFLPQNTIESFTLQLSNAVAFVGMFEEHGMDGRSQLLPHIL